MSKIEQKIPEGWSVKKLEDCFSFLKTPSYSRAETTDSGEVRYIHYGDIHTKYHLHVCPTDIDIFVSAEQARKGDLLKTGDLILLDASEDYEGTTKCIELVDIKENDKVISGLHTLALRDNTKNFANGFRAYITSIPFVKDLFWKQVSGFKVYGVSKDNLKKLKLIFPPLAEQEKIADILGTWDEAIEKLSNLIEQKKLLKKGLMQKLLTGKVRLFKTSPLAGEVADLSAGEGFDYNDNIKISSHRMYQPYIKEFSRDMRKNSTKAENLLWQKIRNGQLGFKFRRQHQIDNKYIADFICLEKRLIIELDGGQHNDRPKDKDRTLYLENNNFKVIRFWDNEILQNIDGCLEILLKEISLLNTPSPCPSPARGEGISATYSNSLPQGARKNERFSQPWKEVKLGNFCRTFSGGTPSVNNVSFYDGNIPFIRSGEIHLTSTALFISESGLTNSAAKLVEKGDILFALYGATSGEVDISKINGAINQAILCIKPLSLNKYFLKDILEYKKQNILNKYLQGGQGNLSAEIIKSLKIYIPSDISEQQAIANVLSTADDEIDLLNKKLTLFKEQKKGLMQQLLTGNIRVKVN